MTHIHLIGEPGLPGLCLVMGDFNFRPDSLSYRILRSVAGLGDAWTDAQLSNEGDPGYTIHADHGPAGEALSPKRIDYVMFWPGYAGTKLAYSRVTMNGWAKAKLPRVKRSLSALSPAMADLFQRSEERDSRDDYFYSDHFGVEAVFELGNGKQDARAPIGTPLQEKPPLREMEAVLREFLPQCAKRMRRNLAVSASLFALTLALIVSLFASSSQTQAIASALVAPVSLSLAFLKLFHGFVAEADEKKAITLALDQLNNQLSSKDL